jgi:hypothetical protein
MRSQAGSTVDDEKAQGFDAQDAIAKGSFSRKAVWGWLGSGAVESCASGYEPGCKAAAMRCWRRIDWW